MAKLILIVDDTASNLRLLRDILTYKEYEVIEASNGEEAIKLAKEKKPDLVLMDIQLPGIDGISAGKILRTDPQTSNVKLIAVTSYAMKGDKEMLLKAGFDDYTSKPINIAKLLEQLEKILG